MARTKEFDRDRALEKAMCVFWRRGYEATSLDDLLEAMGIARQSLYDTFGDKHALLMESLQRYTTRRDEELTSALESAGPVRKRIGDLFMAVVSESAADKRLGCFGVNTAVELAPHDGEIARFIADRQRSTETIFFRALKAASASGEISPAKDPRALARYFVSALQGLRVSAKADPASPALGDIARIALQALD